MSTQYVYECPICADRTIDNVSPNGLFSSSGRPCKSKNCCGFYELILVRKPLTKG